MLLPGLLPIKPVLVVAWSLSYEVFFYISLAILMLVLAFHRYSRPTRIALIASAGLALCLLYSIGVRVPIRMLPFFAGMLLYEMESFGFRAPQLSSLVALLAPLVTLLVGLLFQMPGALRELMHTAAFSLLCAACFSGKGLAASLFSWSPIRWLGNMSYSYYLMHGFAVTIAAMAVAKVLGNHASFWPLLPAFFVLSIIPAALLFIVVEKPVSLAPRSAILVSRSPG
jgi:peptidoglycan/LPS O-acetylase OafA/YrhL